MGHLPVPVPYAATAPAAQVQPTRSRRAPTVLSRAATAVVGRQLSAHWPDSRRGPGARAVGYWASIQSTQIRELRQEPLAGTRNQEPDSGFGPARSHWQFLVLSGSGLSEPRLTGTADTAAALTLVCSQYGADNLHTLLRQELPGLTDDDITWPQMWSSSACQAGDSEMENFELRTRIR